MESCLSVHYVNVCMTSQKAPISDMKSPVISSAMFKFPITDILLISHLPRYFKSIH